MTSPRLNGKTPEHPTMYEDVDSASMLAAEPPESGPVNRVAHEMDALHTAMRAVEDEDVVNEAHVLCRTYLARMEPTTVEEKVIEAALRRILHRSVSTSDVEPDPTKWENYVSESVALTWLAWAANDNAQARSLAQKLRSKRKKVFTDRTGALHLYTLSFWSQAVQLLVEGDPAGARRYFKRAIEMGSQFGTESHPMISWAYAASFRR